MTIVQTIAPIEATLMTATGKFLQAVLPAGTEVVQAQDNGVPMPKGPFVAMTSNSTKRLATNVETFTDPGADPVGTLTISADTQFTIQVDFYGPNSSDWANTVMVLFRDSFGVSAFPDGITPLYTSEPIQIPMVTGEQTYLQRWRVGLELEYSPTVILSQQSATQLQVGLINVDAVYPP